MDKNICPICGKPKKYWFPLCWDCNEKEKQKPTCEVCGATVPEGHFLCKDHWKERQEGKNQLRKIDFVKNKKEQEFKEKFEGKYYFNSQKVKSKSELLICYFLFANQVQFLYETPINPKDKEYRPDFIIDDGKGNYIIIEHFGLDSNEYKKKMDEKIRQYERLCKEQKEFHFTYTTEEDMYNLKERLGEKLNATPLKRTLWK